VCITSSQTETKSSPNPNPDPNPTTKQRAIVNIQLNVVNSVLRIQINSYETYYFTVCPFRSDFTNWSRATD